MMNQAEAQIETLKQELEAKTQHLAEMKPEPALEERDPAAYQRAMHEWDEERHATMDIETRLLRLRRDAKPNE